MNTLRGKIFDILEPYVPTETINKPLDQIMNLIEGSDDEVSMEVIMKIVMAYHNKIRNLRTKDGIPYIPPKAKVKIKQRLREWSYEELIQAIENFSLDEWWMKTNAQRPLDWFFHSYERIDQFNMLKPKVKETDEVWKIGDKTYRSLEEIQKAEKQGEIYYDQKAKAYYPAATIH